MLEENKILDIKVAREMLLAGPAVATVFSSLFVSSVFHTATISHASHQNSYLEQGVAP